MRPHKQFAKLKAINCPAAPRGVDGVHRQIKSLLEPVGDAVGPLGCAVERVVGNDAARESRSRSPAGSKIAVNHEIELTLVFNLSVVDLDLVGLRKGRHGDCKQCESDPSQ